MSAASSVPGESPTAGEAGRADTTGRLQDAELENEEAALFDAVDGDVLELLSDDLALIAADLKPDTTTLVLVWENRWATAFAETVRRAGGTLRAHHRIPRLDVERALHAVSIGEGT